MPGIIFPDVEALVCTRLAAALAARGESYAANVAVRNKVPTEQPGDLWPTSKRLVVVRDDGGQHLGDVRAVARLGVRVWAATESEASDLANLASALVEAFEGVWPVLDATSARPFSVTEASTRPCMYFTAELVVRGVGL